MMFRVVDKRRCLLVAAALLTPSCGPPDPELAAADYSRAGLPIACAPGSRAGEAGGTHRLETAAGLRVSVRTPSNYDATRAHPLLVVYAPGGHHRYQSERFYGLTRPATARGFVVAYPDHVTLKLASFKRLGDVPSAVAAKWCIDQTRIYATGHSDGGLASQAVVFLAASQLPIAGIVASAAGIRGEDLSAYACPAPLPVMIVHSRDDKLFPLPAYGRDAADWWARCNQCRPDRPQGAGDGCRSHTGCAAGAATRYCEITGPHRQWHGMSAAILDFLEPARAQASAR